MQIVSGIHDYQFSTSLNWIELREVNPYRSRRELLFSEKGGKKAQHEKHCACTQECEDEFHSDRPGTIVRRTPRKSFDNC
jgi:hypothetical protein